MNMNIKNNENKGFSLVELIVVIAIMAVLTSVLAPALLQYVERSRAQKDDSAMGEVTNAVKISLADQNVYDEFLKFNAKELPAEYASTGIADETEYAFSTAKKMRGVVITFAPETNATTKAQEMILNNAKINDITDFPEANYTYGVPTVAKQVSSLTKFAEQMNATIGSKVTLTSQTYRASKYSVFVEMETVEKGVRVHGEWNGKNLG